MSDNKKKNVGGSSEQGSHSTSGNYPSTTLSMTCVPVDTMLRVRYDKLIDICASLVDTLNGIATGHESQQLTYPNLFASTLTLLARRLYFIKASRKDEYIAGSIEPSMNLSIMPRPIYSFLSCLGDIEIKEYGHRIRLHITEEEILYLCDASNDILTNGFDRDTGVLGIRATQAVVTQRNYAMLAAALNVDPPVQATYERFLRRSFPQPGGMADDVYALLIASVNGWLVTPVRIDGRYAFNVMMNEAAALFYDGVIVTLNLVPVIGGFYRRIDDPIPNVKRNEVMVAQTFTAVLQRMTARYKFTHESATSTAGAPSLLANVVRAGVRGYYVTSALMMSPSHLAMAYICDFRLYSYLSRNMDAYQSAVDTHPPLTRLNIWVQSNIITKQ